MSAIKSKHLSEISNEFERGIFLSVYNSNKQKLNRSIALFVLVIRHVLRGLLFSWPLYLLALAAYSISDASIWVVLLLLLPAMYISWGILNKGIREDYESLVYGYLLRSGYIGRMIFYGKI